MVNPWRHWSLEHPFDAAGNPVIVCPECEGTGKGEARTFGILNDPEDEEEGHCPVCCGFGRLDW